MADVHNLPSGAEPPDGDRWVRIRRQQDKRYVVQICEDQPRLVIRYDSDIEDLPTAIWRAKQEADRIGVATVYVVGCLLIA